MQVDSAGLRAYHSFMRLLAALLFLLTPLRSVAAVALCVAAEHGHAAACAPGMAKMGEGEDPSPMAYSAAPGQGAAIGSADTPDSLAGCGADGLCGATLPGVTPMVAALLREQKTHAGPLSFPPHLGPGTRPAPPLQPPRA